MSYNSPRKDKVTLAFAGLLYESKRPSEEDKRRVWKVMQLLENEVDSFPVQAKDCTMSLKKNGLGSNRLSLG